MKKANILDTTFASLKKINDTTIEITTKSNKTFVRALTQHQNDEYSFQLQETIWRGQGYSRLETALQTIIKPQPQTTERKVEIDFNKPTTTKHYQYSLIKTCIQNDVPVYLVGEAGTGKNYTLQEIATDLKLDFYFTNSVQQEYKLTGFIDAGGTYHTTEFYQAFTSGGLFFLDEIDASIPEVLVLLNAAIANRYFEFPVGKANAHPDFRVVSAGNTVGSGANELYTGRLVLDQATLDRFVVIEFNYDRNIELQLAHNNEHLVNFIRGLRRVAKEQGIRATFSYRAILTTTKLEAAGIPLEQILTIAVLKGLDKDTIRTLSTDLSKDGNAGKYYYALENIKKAA